MPGATRAALAVAAGTAVIVVVLTWRVGFLYDEWIVAARPTPWTLSSYFYPHGEHWSTLLLEVYRALLATAGLRTHLPYAVCLALLHAACCFLLYQLVAARHGTGPGLWAMAVLALLGQGWQDILLGFQMGFLGSVAFGLLALCLLEGPGTRARLAGASVALLAALMWQGVGLFFLAATAVQLLLQPERRRLLVLVLPVTAQLAWAATFGASSLGADLLALNPELALQLGAFLLIGVASASAGLAGLTYVWGWLALPALGAGLAAVWSRRGPDPRSLGAIAGLVWEYVIIGLARIQHYGVAEAASPRYLYVGAVFTLLIAAGVVARLAWRLPWRPLFLILSATAIASNGAQLLAVSRGLEQLSAAQAVEIRTLEAFRSAPDLNLDASAHVIAMPLMTPRMYFRTVDRFGRTVAPVPAQELDRQPHDLVDGELRSLFLPALRASGASDGDPAGRTCTSIASDPTRIDLPSGSAMLLRSDRVVQVRLRLAYLAAPPAEPDLSRKLVPGQAVQVRVPDLGQPVSWRLFVGTEAGGAAQACR